MSVILKTPSNGSVTLAEQDTASDVVVTVPAVNGSFVTADASGNVGLGTASPVSRAHVSGGAYPQLTIDDAATRTYGIGVTSASLTFYDRSASAERARIDSSGNLLVGTTNSGTNTGVAIQPNSQGAGNANINVSHPSGVNGNAYIQFVYSTASVIGAITQNGTTGVSYLTSSDYRLKENVAPMTGALATVAQLKPCTYTWKADGSAGQGFIAHELQAVVPDCVTGEKDAVDAEGKPQYQGVDTSFLVATLVAAIQELNAKVAALEAQLQGAA